MDFKIHPRFRARNREEEIFYRLEKFCNLCRKMSYETQLGKAVTIKYMNKVLKYAPLLDAPELNSLFELVSETIFAMHLATVNEGANKPTLPQSSVDKADIPEFKKYDIFDQKNKALFRLEMDLYRKLRQPPQNEQTKAEKLATDKIYSALAGGSMYRIVHAAVLEGVKHLIDIIYLTGLSDDVKFWTEAVEYRSGVVAADIVSSLHTPYTDTKPQTESPKNVGYTRSKTNIKTIGLESAMTLVKGKQIKQKVSSGHEDIAFGWTRPHFAAPKAYGFYCTFNTYVVP